MAEIVRATSASKTFPSNLVQRGRLRELLWLLAAVVLLAFGYWFSQTWNTKSTIRLRISGGDVTSTRHKIATSLANHLGSYDIELELHPSEGSEQSLQWLNDSTIDLALIQGGLNLLNRTQVRQLLALQIEPLHVLVKPDLEPKVMLHGLIGLRGHRVFLGPASSGTRVLANNILDFVGLSTSTDPSSRDVIVEDQLLTYQSLLAADRDALPDAIFSVSTVPSPVVNALVDRWEYRLVPIPFALAFSQSAMIEWDNSAPSATQEAYERELDRTLFSACVIPAYTYGVEPDIPASDLSTLGARMLLVANRNVSTATIERLLKAVFASDFGRSTIPGLNSTALELPTEYPAHPGVERYRDRNKVLIASDLIDYLEKVLAIAATLAGAGFFLFQGFSEYRRSKREGQFAEFMTRVIAIEQAALNNEVASRLDLSDLIRLQRELAQLKAEAVQGFVAGEWQGTNMLNGLLALVNDTREQITRLILHERENIEQNAASKKIDPDELWRVEASEHASDGDSGPDA